MFIWRHRNAWECVSYYRSSIECSDEFPRSPLTSWLCDRRAEKMLSCSSLSAAIAKSGVLTDERTYAPSQCYYAYNEGARLTIANYKTASRLCMAKVIRCRKWTIVKQQLLLQVPFKSGGQVNTNVVLPYSTGTWWVVMMLTSRNLFDHSIFLVNKLVRNFIIFLKIFFFCTFHYFVT